MTGEKCAATLLLGHSLNFFQSSFLSFSLFMCVMSMCEFRHAHAVGRGVEDSTVELTLSSNLLWDLGVELRLPPLHLPSLWSLVTPSIKVT